MALKKEEAGVASRGHVMERTVLLVNCDLTLALEAGLLGSSPQSLGPCNRLSSLVFLL